MKALPKLSKAQQEAWARILQWYAKHGKEPFSGYDVMTHTNTLEAMKNKGILRLWSPFDRIPRYEINPDYLPASEPAAEPESEPAEVDDEPLSEGLTNAIRAIWERNFEMVDMGEAALAAGMIERERAKFGNHPTFETIGNEVRANWKARNLESASEPATDDRETSDEARLIDSITEARMERDLARNEVASLKGQLEALRVHVAALQDTSAQLRNRVTTLEAQNKSLRIYLNAIVEEAVEDLGDWLPVAFDQVPQNVRAMKAIYEGARDALVS